MKRYKILLTFVFALLFFFIIWRFILPYIREAEPENMGGYHGHALIYALINTLAFMATRLLVFRKTSIEQVK